MAMGTIESQKLHKLFREIWDEREDEYGICYCFETGAPMEAKIYRHNTTCYDHVLEKGKGKFPQYKFTKKNIIIILPKVHFQKTRDISKTPKIKKYREELLSLHNNGKLEDKW